MPVSQKSRRLKRKTRKQRGGSIFRRLRQNMEKASNLGKPQPGQLQGSSDVYYAPVEDRLDEGYGLIIGPRIAGLGDELIKNAVYPYEECIVLLHLHMGEEYPLKPPHVLHMTPGILGTPNYRIHPNLYEAHGTDLTYSRKTCLGILGTWGPSEWKPEMGPAEVISGIRGILEADPGTYEPGGARYKSTEAEGILYNKHTFAECLEITCAIYKAVLRAVSADATSNSISITANNIKRARIPKELAPFVENLARRAYSGLGFLIRKTEEFIRLNGGPIQALTRQIHHNHKHSRVVDFGKLLACLKEAREMVPVGLQKNIFISGIGEIHRNLYEFTKQSWEKSGKPVKTYEEFVKKIEKQLRKERRAAARAAAGPAAAGATVNNSSSENENENESENERPAATFVPRPAASGNNTEYYYSNENTGVNNGSPGALEELND